MSSGSNVIPYCTAVGTGPRVTGPDARKDEGETQGNMAKRERGRKRYIYIERERERYLLIGMRVSTGRLSIRTEAIQRESPREERTNAPCRKGTGRGEGRERAEKERQRDSSERLEDNAIIRNYRVRPRFAELSHSVSITGTVIPAYPTPAP